MIPLGGVAVLQKAEGGRGESVRHEGDDSGGIGFDGESDHRKHELKFFEEAFFVLNVLGLGHGRAGLGGDFPLAVGVEAFFDFADGGEVLIEPGAIEGTHFALEAFGVLEEGVQNAAAFFETQELALDGFGAALKQTCGERGPVHCPRRVGGHRLG